MSTSSIVLFGGGLRPPAAPVPARIRPLGYNFVDPAGKIVIRKGITAFTLPKRYATDRRAEANAYQSWVASRGLNEERIFARVVWTGPPGSGVEPGWEYNEAACEEALVEAAARGLRLQIVAHTGPHGDLEDMAEHLWRVDQLCLRHDNALLEVWNEPQQNGGHDLVQRVLELYTPQTPGWSTGVYDQTPYTSVVQTGWTTDDPPRPIYSPTAGARVGQSMDYHSERGPKMPRTPKSAYEYGTGQGPNVAFTPGYSGPVMLSEPDQMEQTIRDRGAAGAADDWRAYGAGAVLFACGAGGHSNPTFQQCTIPTDPALIGCVDALVAGFNDVPVQRYHGYFRGDPPTPSDPDSRRYFRWGDDNRQYEICVRPYSFRAV